MDLKADDIFDIDPALLLSYELDKLNLDSIPNDIFDLSDEIAKIDVKLDVVNDYQSQEKKITEIPASYCSKNKATKLPNVEDKPCDAELKVEAPSRNIKRKKDVNGNDEPVTDKNLNQLFIKLELSDSDNEQVDDVDSSKLKERGPLRPRRRANRSRDPISIWSRSETYDKTQFNSERLKFWSGSNQVQTNEIQVPSHQVIHDNLTAAFCRNDPVHSILNQESFYEDARASSVSSPESGYDSSAHSITGSPPPVSLSTLQNLDFIPESVDEQNILDFLIENTDGALPDNNIAVGKTDEKDIEGKITEIINFLKDTPAELGKSPETGTLSDNSIPDHVPFVSNSEDSNTISMKLPVFSCNSVAKNCEIPKKLVYKLNDKAKWALFEFLSKDEYYAAQERIYKKIHNNKEDAKVIYVEDEMDKASENRTNLHHAVLKGKIEDIYCLIEIHKQYNKPFTDINIRDKYGKTALDYAMQNKMTLVVDYLKENTACQSVNI